MKTISRNRAVVLNEDRPDAAHDRQDHAPHFIFARCVARLFFDVGQTDRFIISLEKT